MKKNLSNLGFTLYEVLAVIAIIGVIASISVPIVIVNQQKYKEMTFNQNAKLYEKVFLDTHEKYQFSYYGTTPLTKKTKLRVPFYNIIETEEEEFVDILDTTYAFYFIYETLVDSPFPYEEYHYDYSPATITKRYSYFPSLFTLYLNDDVTIEYHLEVMTSSVNYNQSAYIRKVVINQYDYSYSFEV